jgi:hypothetical protein
MPELDFFQEIALIPWEEPVPWEPVPWMEPVPQVRWWFEMVIQLLEDMGVVVVRYPT